MWNGGQINGPTGAGFAAFRATSSFGIVFVENTFFLKGDRCIMNDTVNSGQVVVAREIFASGAAPGDIGYTIHCTNQGSVFCDVLISQHDGVHLYADGNDASINCKDGVAREGSEGAYSLNGATIRCYTMAISNNTYNIRLDTGGDFFGNACMLEGANVDQGGTKVYDIYQEAAGCRVWLSNSSVANRRFYFYDPFQINMQYLSDNKYEGSIFTGPMSQGLIDDPHDAFFAGGEPVTRGMLVYQYDAGTTTFTDVSAAARDTSTQFGFGTAVNDAIYVALNLRGGGGQAIKHSGIKNISQVIAANLGTGSIVAEYWSGATWTPFKTMCVLDQVKTPYANTPFERSVSEDIRYSLDMLNNWIANDPIVPTIGTNYFWVRFRVATAITTGPSFRQWKLWGSSAVINDSGWKEAFGFARPVGNMSWNWGIVEPSTAAPGAQDLYVSDNLYVGLDYNDFAPSVTRRVGFNIYLPGDLDTSEELYIALDTVPQANTAGTVQWEIRWGYTADGDNIYPSTGTAPATGPNEQLLTQIQNISAGWQDTQRTEVFRLDVSDMVSRRSGAPGDMLWLTISRNGGADSFGGSIAIANIRSSYIKWNNGGFAF
jgi:hypothetical protein